MPKEKFVVATKKNRADGTVIPGEPLGEFRKAEFADHALPSLARQEKIALANLGVFLGDKLVSTASQ